MQRQVSIHANGSFHASGISMNMTTGSVNELSDGPTGHRRRSHMLCLFICYVAVCSGEWQSLCTTGAKLQASSRSGWHNNSAMAHSPTSTCPSCSCNTISVNLFCFQHFCIILASYLTTKEYIQTDLIAFHCCNIGLDMPVHIFASLKCLVGETQKFWSWRGKKDDAGNFARRLNVTHKFEVSFSFMGRLQSVSNCQSLCTC